MSSEDYALLLALPAATAAELEPWLHEQARHSAEVAEQEMLESELGGQVSIDFIVCERVARWSHGTGGGRRRRPLEPAPC
jgi:hypothetical protein